MERMERKAAIAAYKLTRPSMGVYQIRNETNGRILVGSSVNLPARWNRERAMLRFGSHTCRELQSDWKEWGENNFSFTVLEVLKVEDNQPLSETEIRKRLEKMEECWLEKLQPYQENGYNRVILRRKKAQ